MFIFMHIYRDILYGAIILFNKITQTGISTEQEKEKNFFPHELMTFYFFLVLDFILINYDIDR
jgi:hypothetical protein